MTKSRWHTKVIQLDVIGAAQNSANTESLAGMDENAAKVYKNQQNQVMRFYRGVSLPSRALEWHSW